MRLAALLSLVTLLLASGCYEDRFGCLDPDATNFDERADQFCPDGCCEYPILSLDVDSNWGDTTLASQELLVDGAGSVFEVTRFRFYLSDLGVATVGGETVVENIIETAVVAGTDTVLTDVNANLVLASNTSGDLAAGTFRTGTAALTGVRGLFGTADDFPAVYPPEAPSGSPLATQPDLLNFNDDTGYLLGSLDLLLLPDSTVRRIDLAGNLPLELPFGTEVEPLRGFNLTVEIAADYQVLLGGLNLRADSTQLANDLRARLPGFLRVTGIR